MNGRCCVALGVALVAIAAREVGVGAAREPDTRSSWRAAEVTVDGKDTEWRELTRLPKANLSAGFVNDAEALYVCVVTSDQFTRQQVLRQGLQIWLDAQGGTKKRIGIRFPASVLPPRGAGSDMTGGPPPGGRDGTGRPPARASESTPRANAAGEPGEPQLPPEMQHTIEILGSDGKDRRTVALDGMPEFAAHVGMVEGRLVWEVRIPIARTALEAWPFVAAPGTTIGVGFETTTPDMGRPRGPGMDDRGGGDPGRRGGMGPPGGGSPGGGRGMDAGRMPPEQPKPISAWVTVKLAGGS